jgi:sigma-B regulation protein RsbU (phosphoserine phosphatase)
MTWENSKPITLKGLYARNYTANIFGNFTIILLNRFTPLDVLKDWQDFIWQQGGILLIPFFMLTVYATAGLMQFFIQRPISLALAQLESGKGIDGNIMRKAKHRLLNLHVILAAANLMLWFFFTLCLIGAIYFVMEMNLVTCAYIFFRGIIIGLIAAFLAFFLMDHFCRKNLVPILFPEGRLADLEGTIKISIIRRIRILYGAGTGAPMLMLIGTLGLVLWEIDDTAVTASAFGKDVFVFIVVLYTIFVAIALSLNFMVGRSILNPITEMMKVLRKVQRGNFHRKVKVVSNDELGRLGDGINEMTQGLLERDRMRESLNLAKEVQHALLPQAPPEITGLDMAAHINYCDETGGDYYDFFYNHDTDPKKISILIGDVSGHGVPSALLMASARAFFRQRLALPGSISQVVSDVNRQLAIDVRESGAFMTLFYLTIDLNNSRLNWVRAGHDPVILYDSGSGRFEKLRGSGLALGVDDKHIYKEYKKEGLTQGQILVLGTDGIWEAQNSRGDYFGKDPLFRIIRQYADIDAKGLLTTCLFSLEKFRGDAPPEDDATLIVVKVANSDA